MTSPLQLCSLRGLLSKICFLNSGHPMGMVPDPPNQVFLKIITGKLNSLMSIFVLVLADQRTGHASLDHVLMGEVCNKMDTTYVLAVRGVLMMFQSLFYWYTTSSYSILGEHGKKSKIFFGSSDMLSLTDILCHVRDSKRGISKSKGIL